ncbi:hypothetical protein ACFYYP_19455 [Microbispora rosea]|uniref:hypothetical protein n=1 Tax=Microbispora rosea TaxID=58117 RepID=UPI0036B8436D
MTDLNDRQNEPAESASTRSEMHVNNHASVANQQNIENYFAADQNPEKHLKAARRALEERRWVQACQHYIDYLKHEPSSSKNQMAEVRVEYALARLEGKRPRSHTDQTQNEIQTSLTQACEFDPKSRAASVLMAIFNEDVDHAFLIEADLSDEVLQSATDLDLHWAKRIVSAISVPESPTWEKLFRRANPDSSSPTIALPSLSEEEQSEREHRMRTLFTPAPSRPEREPRLNPIFGLLPFIGGSVIIWVAIALMTAYGNPGWSVLSPGPYIAVVGISVASIGGWLTFGALFGNWRQNRIFHQALVEYRERRRIYEDNLPTEEQITRWVKRDVAVIVDRALKRLGIVMEELRNTGRITDPLVIVGPAEPPKTKLVRHPRVGEGYIASRYTVFVVCMADQKLGAYRTTLDSITGIREPEEHTSEYRYRDIVSVNVKTVRLDLPADAKKTDEAEPTYAFVDAEEKDTVAERFTLVVPGDRFTVTTKVSTEDGKGSRIEFSKADRALAAIRRRIAASTRQA